MNITYFIYEKSERKRQRYLNSCLIYAILDDDIESVKSCLKHGADINYEDYDNCTGLMHAAYNGNLQITKLLIENGADVYYSNKDNNSAVVYAAGNGHLEIVELFLKQREYNYSQLSIAFNMAIITKNYNIAKLLKSIGIEINSTMRYGSEIIKSLANIDGEIETILYYSK